MESYMIAEVQNLFCSSGFQKPITPEEKQTTQPLQFELCVIHIIQYVDSV